VTVPAWLPERICWRLSDDYHNVPGGHVRIYTRPELEAKLRRAGLTVGPLPPCAWPATRPTGGSNARWGVGSTTIIPGARLPPAAGLGHHEAPRAPHPAGGTGAEPAHRQEPGALRPQARRRGGHVRPTVPRAARTMPRAARDRAGPPRRLWRSAPVRENRARAAHPVPRRARRADRGRTSWPPAGASWRGQEPSGSHRLARRCHTRRLEPCRVRDGVCRSSDLREPARRAYGWLRAAQRADGSWPRERPPARPRSPIRPAESNQVAYGRSRSLARAPGDAGCGPSRRGCGPRCATAIG
jgi:hypothetical protein